ncbi:gamma-aminobutyric acid type B receptor subunit 2-like [Embiotoca jacksoni]|uniref:gamma-aminobutyric acid type B receptor subunit 2-like n=1 Tax=Embiotoca jacksoni TaxID=100190 RepID=UPI0037046211
MWAGPRYLLVLGGVCPGVTALIGRSLPALSLVQVSFAASSPGLSNRRWYGNLFSTVPSDRALNRAAVKLLQGHKWSRVGLVTQNGPRLSEMKRDLIRQLLKADVQLVASETLSEDVCSSLRTMKDRDVRIIIGQFEEDSLSEVFCCVSTHGSQKYVDTGGVCSSKEKLTFRQFHKEPILLSFLEFNQDSVTQQTMTQQTVTQQTMTQQTVTQQTVTQQTDGDSADRW